jgi:hypothetical protein
MDWSGPEDIKRQVERYWNDGRLLAADFEAAPLFPLALRFRRPDSRALVERFDEVRRWIRQLDGLSKSRRGYGYELKWTTVNHRHLGHNEVPCAVSIPTSEDALSLIGKTREAAVFRCLASETMARVPALRDWLIRRPLVSVEYADDWKRILCVIEWFLTHPCSGRHLRQLDISGVDTKFIETRKQLLSELLDLALVPDAIDAQFPPSSFEQRYRLATRPALVRFRVLDSSLRIAGFSDLTVPLSEFAAMNTAFERAFVTENEINGLAFPDMPRSIVVFGMGYGVQSLAAVEWLRRVCMHYWGDIDTHGFAILDRFRAAFPRSRSLLMDRDTLLANRGLWTEETQPYLGAVWSAPQK